LVAALPRWALRGDKCSTTKNTKHTQIQSQVQLLFVFLRFEDHCRPFDTLRTGIEYPPVIVKILSHLGLPTRAPSRAPARRVDLFQTIGEAQTAERPKPDGKARSQCEQAVRL